jgi:aldose 1-epimerase
MRTTLFLVALCAIFCFAQGASPSITDAPFGKHEGKPVRLYTLTNSNNTIVRITNYGGIVTSLLTKDRKGAFGDIVLGFDNLPDYENKSPYFGALIGRYGNRIAKGTFTLNGKVYHLYINDPPNSEHGGKIGFDKRIWNVDQTILEKDRAALQLSYISPDGEEGYPGTLKVIVTYSLTNNNELIIEYKATTDQDTVINLTHHSYFNLAAGKTADSLQHRLQLNADRYTVVDGTLIPTGELKQVSGTPFDFLSGNDTIGSRIAQVSGGYDHNYVLGESSTVRQVATVWESTSGRVMQVLTDQPGIQFYSGNFLDGTITGKYGVKYVKYYGFCLETQHYPDSPNHPQFPTTVLKAGQVFQTKTIYKFSVMA